MKMTTLSIPLGLAFKLSLFACSAGAATINSGDLVVSELLANPAAVSDGAGEWLELYNAGQSSLDLNGLVLRDSGSNNHTINAATPLTMAPGDYLVLGRNGDSTSNGGYQPDYVYSNFSLSNSSDDIILEWQGSEIFSLSYTAADNFGQAGISMVLTGISDTIDASDYLPSSADSVFGNGDRGSPGIGSLSHPTVSEVPLPASGLLFCSSLGLLAGIKRRLRH